MTLLKDIPLSDIALGGEGWDRYVFNVAPRVDALAESIERVGINMPLAAVRSDEGCILVSGYARALAALKTGRKSVPCFIIEAGAMTDEQLLELSIEDNRFVRPYHYLDAARILRAFRERCGYSDSRLAGDIAPLIGIPRSERVVGRHLSLNDLGEPLRRMLVEKGLSLAHAILLAEFDEEDTGAVAEFFLRVSANANEAKEAAEILKDLARIGKKSVREILGLAEIANAPKAEARRALRKLRYPALDAAEEEFEKLAAKMRLDTNVAVSHSPNFENDLLRLAITARSPEEFDSILSRLKAGADSGLIKQIFAIPRAAEKRQ